LENISKNIMQLSSQTSNQGQQERCSPHGPADSAWTPNLNAAINEYHPSIRPATQSYENFNLNKPKPVIIHDPYKVAMLKYLKYQPVLQEDIKSLAHHKNIIGITSKQWGAQADFGWCTTYQGDMIHNTVMIMSSFNDCTQADLHYYCSYKCNSNTYDTTKSNSK
jgi:hypothetical protein